MGKIAFVFAGQGTQYPGMGREICCVSAAARKVFDMADRLRPGTSKQCFEGSKQELEITANTQPCLFTVDLACAVALEEAGIAAQGAAGFSLGEIAALAFSGFFKTEDAFSLVLKRAEFMQECSEQNKGAMAAVLKLSNEQVEELAAKFKNVFPVNYNCPGQLVVAGQENELNVFISEVAQSGGRAVKLAVSGAFHSPFMETASQRLLKELDQLELQQPRIPLYANVTAKQYCCNVKEMLSEQVKSPVQWQKTIENMIGDGYDIFIEVGAGKTLTGLIKKINSQVHLYNVQDKESLESTLQALNGGQHA